MSAPAMRGAIYVASKAVAHGPMWQARRAAGWPIISTWIDESDPGATLNWPDLWDRCLNEAAAADVLIVYREPGEVLKGAFIEIGVALSKGTPVIAVGMEDYTISKSGKLVIAKTLDEAFDIAAEILEALPLREEDPDVLVLPALEWEPKGTDTLVSALWSIKAEGHELLLFERGNFRSYHPDVKAAKNYAEERRKEIVAILTGLDAIIEAP